MEDCNDLQLHVHTLGYYPIGECILLVIVNKKSGYVYRSHLIDCFKTSQTDELSPLLTHYGIDKKRLDSVIWTHPDADHCEGLETIIDDFCDKDHTNYFIPMGIDKRQSFSETSQRILEHVLSLNKIKKLSVHIVSGGSKYSQSSIIMRDEFSDGLVDNIKVEAEILTPNADMSFFVTQKDQYTKNDISISILLTMGQWRLYFGGDATDKQIAITDPNSYKNLDFIKIPHHGSKSSVKLLDFLEEEYEDSLQDESLQLCPCQAVCTSWKSANPHKDVLDRYIAINKKVYLTDNTCRRTANYGIWSFMYDIVSHKCSESHIGDACIYKTN